MDVKGNLQLFVSKRGEYRFYQASISRKLTNGKYIHTPVDVEFAKDFGDDKLAKLEEGICYTIAVDSGFLSVSAYTDKEGKNRTKLVIHVDNASVVKSTPIQKQTNDNPF